MPSRMKLLSEEILPMPFIPGITAPQNEKRPAWWFAFRGNNLLVQHRGNRVIVPCAENPSLLHLHPLRIQFLGTLNGLSCYSAECPPGTKPQEGMEFLGLRQLFSHFEEEWIGLASRAIQMMKWDQRTQYCGRCGGRTVAAKEERAKWCPSCGLRQFPRISPAVIVAVTRENRILLAHAGRFKDGMYSVLAGFVEPGETLEECLRREVREEVGIEIKDIRYFGSQSWPFPDSLMIGFTAQYGGGELTIDQKEILEAGWFSADNLPLIPERISIARRLIDWFVKGGR